MKKLMIVAAMMVVGMTASAYQYRWKIGAIPVNDGSGSEEAYVATGTQAYIFNAKDYSQTALLTAFFDTKTSWENIVNNSFLAPLSAVNGMYNSNSGKLPDVVGTHYNDGGTEMADVYFAILSGDKLFVSDTKGQALDWSGDTATTSFSFTPDYYDNATATVTFDKATGFDGNAWYSAGAVPEPTSGLLLLLGVAGLALRRRRA